MWGVSGCFVAQVASPIAQQSCAARRINIGTKVGMSASLCRMLSYDCPVRCCDFFPFADMMRILGVIDNTLVLR